MSFIGSIELSDKLRKIVFPFNKEKIKTGAYELSIGGEAYVSDSPDGKKQVFHKLNPQIEIKPGQIALLITEEYLEVPLHYIGFISVKAGIKLKGLVNISGFHVDPGFEGKLIFSVYNAGPATIMLEHGQPCFLLWFANISTTEKYNGGHGKIKSIPVGYIEDLKGNMVNPGALIGRLDDTKKELNRILEQQKNESLTQISKLKNELDWIKTLGLAIFGVLFALTINFWIAKEKLKTDYDDFVHQRTVREMITNILDSTRIDSIVHRIVIKEQSKEKPKQ